MARIVLGISWLNGRFHAVVRRGTAVSASWTSPVPVVNDGDFSAALRDAVQETRFSGRSVNVVLDHRSVLFHVQETPPAKGRMLHDLLDRLVRQNRFFEEPAAWTRLSLPPGKSQARHLLALVPGSFLERITQACAEQKLQLNTLLPLAAVLSTQLRQLSLAPDEVVVLAADLDGSLHLVLGRGDGQVLFSRSVVLTGAQQGERASQEINRTLQYAQQQFGAVVSQLFVFGEQAFTLLRDLQIRQGLQVRQSPLAEDPFFHARQAAAASPKTILNLAPRSSPLQRQARKLAAAGLAALLIASATVGLKVELFARAREARYQAQVQQIAIDNNAQAASQARQREADHLAAFLRLVGTTNQPPVPELFARHLATCVPESMRLTQVTVRRDTNGWELHLEGFTRESAGGYLALAAQLDANLRGSPFQVQVTDSTHQRVFGGAPGTSRDGPEPGRPKGGAQGEKPFFVKGVIR